jgi:lipopolysaccharide assembly protein A
MTAEPPPPASPQAGNGQPQQAPPGPPSVLPQHVVKRTRIGGLWVAAGSFAAVLLLLLIFIAENSRTVDVAFFGGHGHLPLGVALLLAAVLGVLLVAVPGTARIIQLRITARRHRRADARQADHGPPIPK